MQYISTLLINCMSKDFLSDVSESAGLRLNNTEPEEAFPLYTHAARPLRMCISVCFLFCACLCVHIYIVPLTIHCMHNLKGKYVRFHVYRCIVV